MPLTMIDHDNDQVGGGAPGRVRLADMQAEHWGVTFSTWQARGVLNGAPVDLRALERAAAVVRPGVGEGVHDWQGLSSSTREGGAPALVWDVRGFYFGSADPHGVGDVDAARVPRRRATFSLLAYDTARLEDLLRRPMPRLNVPATTAPLPPPRPYAGPPGAAPPRVTRRDRVVPVETVELTVAYRQVPRLDVPATTAPPPPLRPFEGLLRAFPPKVTRLDQVVPIETIKLIGRWLRRLRRMAAAARRGNASLARRLRPEDLWLPEDRHTWHRLRSSACASSTRPTRRLTRGWSRGNGSACAWPSSSACRCPISNLSMMSAGRCCMCVASSSMTAEARLSTNQRAPRAARGTPRENA